METVSLPRQDTSWKLELTPLAALTEGSAAGMQASRWQVLGCALHHAPWRPRHIQLGGFAGRSLLGGGGKRARQPVQALVEAIAGSCARRLDKPLAVSQVVQPQLLSDLCGSHGVWQVLLVGKHQEYGIAHLVLIQHLRELLPGILNAVTVVAVNHIYQAIGSLVIVTPKGSDLVLSANIPNSEAEVLVLNRLDIEPDGRDGGNHFAQLQFVQNRRLACGVKSDHQDAHVGLADEALPYLGESEAHRTAGATATAVEDSCLCVVRAKIA
eukprot:CAMPEP_0204574040 /NCGR_PEP_ID=MMETSP0661-20131031/40364_1 /ASSEMBLY_ACC=CAM_ASM_000606 /TAXON_ID=109239 /ORGANISM="Alexandrium margalefi, Strain AMGDE01CS-322" /LENGTH=268 /DNA_ID=CAMNT_0051582527 /DNA_START=42 /DNA_END=849 /DNA_ORIENTATION=-